MLTCCDISTGAYDDEEAAARAYDLAALKYWGPGTLINFPVRYMCLNIYSDVDTLLEGRFCF